VVAEIVIEKHVLLVEQDGIIHHIFPFAIPVEWKNYVNELMIF
jgi:hypothetical protein